MRNGIIIPLTMLFNSILEVVIKKAAISHVKKAARLAFHGNFIMSIGVISISPAIIPKMSTR